jgi:hypothetical protein
MNAHSTVISSPQSSRLTDIRARNADIARRIALFRSIVIEYPRHLELHDRLDYLQSLGRDSQGGAQMGLRVLAPSGSGKSTAAKAYKKLVEELCPPSDVKVPVLYLPLSSATTSRRLMVQILQALDDRFAEKGTEQALQARAVDYMRRLGVELLIIDEIQHLNFRTSAKNDVTDALKSFLDAGVAPIAFLGTDEALPMFERNLQLNGRLIAPFDMPKLAAARGEDRSLFASFVAALCAQMAEKRIFSEPVNLVQPAVLGALLEVTDGVIGRVSRLFQVAVEAALRRDAATITVEDLSLAVEGWAIPQNFASRNPFRVNGLSVERRF